MGSAIAQTLVASLPKNCHIENPKPSTLRQSGVGRVSALDEDLNRLKEKGAASQIVTEAQYERFLSKLKSATGDQELPPDSKRRIIQALIQEVRITANGFQLRYFAGMEQIKKGEALALCAKKDIKSFSPLAPPLESLPKKISVSSSFFHLNGGPTKNRTWNGPLGKGCYIHLTMGPA